MPSTTRETVRHLCSSILTRLENRKAITLAAVENRDKIREEVFALIGPFVLTDEDLRAQTMEKIGANQSEWDDEAVLESAPYRTARSLVRKSFGDDELNGMFFQKPLKNIASSIGAYLMESSYIDDVFETDEDLERMIVDIVRKFSPNH